MQCNIWVSAKLILIQITALTQERLKNVAVEWFSNEMSVLDGKRSKMPNNQLHTAKLKYTDLSQLQLRSFYLKWNEH